MLEVESTGQHGRCGRNGNETVAGAASEAFSRWLRRRYAPSNCRRRRHIVSPRDTLLKTF